MKEVRLAYTESLIQQVGNYLITRPYGEVAALVDGLQKQSIQVELDMHVDAEGGDDVAA